MICKIENCLNDAKDLFCSSHQISFDKIEKSFDNWKIAYDNKIVWEDYLEQLSESDDVNAGQYVREIAEYLLIKIVESDE